MHSPILPLDILLLILEILPRQTAAEMTVTCRALRGGGARFLLREVVLLTRGSSIISLLRFLTSDMDRHLERFKYLRALEIATGALPRRSVDAFLGLLSHPLLSLNSLILRDAAKLLGSEPTPSHHTPPTLLDAFSTLKTLRHLTIEQCDDKNYVLLSTIQSPLRTISVTFTPLTSWHTPDDAEHRNPIVVLAKAAQTLEEISGENLAIHPDRIMYSIVYPSVRTIRASYNDESMPATLAYVTAFPNATHVSFTSPKNETAAWSETIPPRLRSCRVSNKQTQQTFGHTWKSLEEVMGNLFDLYALGLAYHVPRVRIFGDISPKLLPCMCNVLEDTRPTSLAITIAGGVMFADGTVADAFRGACAQMVHELELELSYSPCEGDIDVQKSLNDVVNTVGVLPLRRLVLILNYGLLTGPNTSHRSRYGYFCPAEKQIDNLDMSTVAGYFRAALPSLDDVSVYRSKDRAGHEHRLGPVGDDASSDNEEEPGRLLVEDDDDGW